jgi:hypothetical protein
MRRRWEKYLRHDEAVAAQIRVTPGTQCQQPVSGCGWGRDDDLGVVDAAGVGTMTWARWARSARGLGCMGRTCWHDGGGGEEGNGWVGKFKL